MPYKKFTMTCKLSPATKVGRKYAYSELKCESPELRHWAIDQGWSDKTYAKIRTLTDATGTMGHLFSTVRIPKEKLPSELHPRKT